MARVAEVNRGWARFCSVSCKALVYNQRERHPNWRGGKRVTDHGYVMVRSAEHPHAINGYVYEHRLVMESVLGRMLESDEEVHHVNGNKADNRPDNLQLLTKADHSLLHMNQRLGRSE